MQFPESWLREFCDPPIGTQALAGLLTMSGMEVEDLRAVAPPFSGVVVGEIVECEPHPNADKLRVCRVDAGAHSKDGPLQVVCGAPNARVGLRAPLALVGARLPGGDDGQPFAIEVGKLRGVESRGMLCSARELKLTDDHGGLLELAGDAKPGADVRELLALDDTIFTLKLTPNLGHALSVYGIAREVAALTGAPLKTPRIDAVASRSDAKLPVTIEAPDLCGRFSGRIVRGVNTKARTPAWMVERLARCGQRPVSALVDLSNYVMFEYGRPSHIFDLDKIHDRLVVRWGRADETLKLLNGETVELDANVGVIADAQDVESLAGIMGGERTAVSDDTRNIYVEAAFWWPDAVAGRSRRFGFATDAGHRFERGVDPALTVEHIERITWLIVEICGGPDTVCGPIDDQIATLPSREPVTMRVERASKVVGMHLDQPQCAAVFERLGLSFTEQCGAITVTPPSWRFDLNVEEDLIEEVIRVVGYGTLPSQPPLAPITARAQPEARRDANALRHALAALGYREAITFSFVEERWERELAGNAEPIRVLNPIAAHLAVMRSSLVGSLLDVLRTNLARKAERVRVFEIGRVYLRDAAARDADTAVAGLHQPLRVAALAYGDADALQWGSAERAVDFFDAKGDVEALFTPREVLFVAASHPALHPGRSARVEVDGKPAGFVGELHPRWRQSLELPRSPVLFELDAEPLVRRDVPAYEPIARRQSAWRDIAVVVSERVTHDELMAVIQAGAEAGLLRSARLFDVYRPKQAGTDIATDERSMAVRLELRDDELTLTDERIDACVARIVAALRERLGARLRT